MQAASRVRLRCAASWVSAWAAVACGAPAWAQSPAPFSWSGELSAASDLSERGLALWPGEPVVQAVASVSDDAHGAIGLSATRPVNNRSDDGSPIGYQLGLRAAGYVSLTDEWQLQARGVGYLYPGSDSYRRHDRHEFTLGASFRDLVSLEWSTTQLAKGDVHLYHAVDLGLRWPLSEQWALSGGLGRAELLAWPDWHYRYSDLGVVWHTTHWRATLSWLHTDTGRTRWLLGEAAEPRWAASASYLF